MIKFSDDKKRIFVSDGINEIELSKEDKTALSTYLISYNEIQNIMTNLMNEAEEMELKFSEKEFKQAADNLYYGWMFETDDENTIPSYILRGKLEEMAEKSQQTAKTIVPKFKCKL